MRAIEIAAPGGPEVLKLVERPLPAPGKGEALVRVEAAGVNYIDVYHRTGLYAQKLPFRPGLEGAGVVVEMGEGESDIEAGDRVAWASGPGSYAEMAIVPVAKLVRVPEKVPLDTAAAVMLQGLTAHYLATSTYPLRPDEWCLVHAAAGGVGLLLDQLASRIGAHVIGTVSTREKAELALRAGAREAVVYTEKDFVAEVLRVTSGQKVSVVYDGVGKATFDKSLDALRPRGMMVLYGQSSGSVPPVDLQILNAKGALYLTRPTLHHYTATRTELLQRADAIFRAIEAGQLSVRVHAKFPLEKAAEAHRALESRGTTGKLLLTTRG